jgi:hypothetical protein
MSEPDRNIQRILERATQDEAFRQALMSDREAALVDADLSDSERRMLMAASEQQLALMIDNAGRPWYRKKLSRKAQAVALGIGAVVVGGTLLLSTPSSAGISPEAWHSIQAVDHLKRIYMANAAYQSEYDVYPTEEALLDWPFLLEMMDDRVLEQYEFVIESTGEDFSAVARHRTRADTRPAFRIGPDGEITELDGATE